MRVRRKRTRRQIGFRLARERRATEHVGCVTQRKFVESTRVPLGDSSGIMGWRRQSQPLMREPGLRRQSTTSTLTSNSLTAAQRRFPKTRNQSRFTTTIPRPANAHASLQIPTHSSRLNSGRVLVDQSCRSSPGRTPEQIPQTSKRLRQTSKMSKLGDATLPACHTPRSRTELPNNKPSEFRSIPNSSSSNDNVRLKYSTQT